MTSTAPLSRAAARAGGHYGDDLGILVGIGPVETRLNRASRRQCARPCDADFHPFQVGELRQRYRVGQPILPADALLIVALTIARLIRLRTQIIF
jgi:hypothetical protein